MNTLYIGSLFVFFAFATCFGLSSYKGLTPGRTTRPDAERVLGRSVRDVSKTLVEYSSPVATRVYVQYADGSAAAIVERIELICAAGCDFGKIAAELKPEYNRGLVPDVRVGGTEKPLAYFGSPRYIRVADNWGTDNADFRLSLMSPALFEADMPTKGCTGTILGSWETSVTSYYLNLGRLKITRTAEGKISGSYDKGNGKMDLVLKGATEQNYMFGHHSYTGTWKDDAASGTVELESNSTGGIIGKFKRTSPAPPKAKGSSAADPFELLERSPWAFNWVGSCVPR